MKFDLNVFPEQFYQDDECEKITKKMELKIAREDFISEYEKDSIACTIALREMHYMFYCPYGYTAQISDEVSHRIYEALKADEKVVHATVHAMVVDSFDRYDYRKQGREVKVDFTLDTLDQSKQSNLLV